MTRREVAPIHPLPVLLLRRGPVSMRSMAALHEDHRLELFAADELTPEWISFAQRGAGTIVATEGDPFSALGYAITAEMGGPIVMAITRRHQVDKKDLLAAGAVAVVTMPIQKGDIDRVIPRLVKQAASARIDTPLRLLLDPVARIVRYHNKTARLSQREFAVLHCLSVHNGRPVSAGDVLSYVWGGANSAQRTRQILDVYIFQLRKKLERIGLKGAISTVRAFGYALVQVTRER